MYEPYLIPHSHPGTHSQIAYTTSSPESRIWVGLCLGMESPFRTALSIIWGSEGEGRQRLSEVPRKGETRVIPWTSAVQPPTSSLLSH